LLLSFLPALTLTENFAGLFPDDKYVNVDLKNAALYLFTIRNLISY